MKMFEIDNAILALIDTETGEILDFDAFGALQMEREAKLESMALWYKELDATATAIREEEKTLAERRKAAENKADRLKEYLSKLLEGAGFETPKCKISYRKSEQVEVADDFLSYAEERFKAVKPPTVDKTALKEALKAGESVQGATLIAKNNIQIK